MYTPPAAAAHEIIRTLSGRGSRDDITACHYLAHGRFADVIALAARLQDAAAPRLHIAA